MTEVFTNQANLQQHTMKTKLPTLWNDEQQARAWAGLLGKHVASVVYENLARIAKLGVTDDLMDVLCAQLAERLPGSADAEMAMNNLEHFFANSISPLSTAAMFERDTEALPILLQFFATSQYLSELLVRFPANYDVLRATHGQPVSREMLVEEIGSEVLALSDRNSAIAALRRFKQRETLRIAYGDIVREQTVSTVTRQISYLADAMVDAAVQYARKTFEKKIGVPRAADGARVPFVVLALGKLGGIELNYSSDIDLIFVYGENGTTDGKRGLTNQEFFSQMGREVAKLLSEPTELGAAYRVDLRLRPEGSLGPVVSSLESTLNYYDSKGRTWERQAYIKARPIAGDLALGKKLLKELEPWIYRRFLSRADITGIKTLKRSIEHRAEVQGDEDRDVKTGRGGIRDIEFVIQFLQLLNCGDMPKLRTGNTLEAIELLEEAGCLTHQERSILMPNYESLRKVEHRLQLMFDLQTHTLPETDEELAKLAIRMGYTTTKQETAKDAFTNALELITRNNRTILDHLLHDAFGEADEKEPEVDLVNNPSPSEERIAKVLGKYGFNDVPRAYKHLMALANEPNRFLSTRRCRHFLGSIAPRLLASIAETPDPDSTLVTLSRVSDLLGGKSALWELLNENRPSLNLIVTLCAACPYLVSILTSHPGMIDELMDSLVLETLPSLAVLQTELAEVAQGAVDIEPVLHSFKNAQHLRVGVRDILGKDDIQATHRALSGVAEVCVQHIIVHEHKKLSKKYGLPTITVTKEPDEYDSTTPLMHREGTPCEPIVLALGKVGGREPNYHSDLDLVFLYETEGQTKPFEPSHGAKSTTNSHYFSELGQKIIKMAGRLGPFGRLYEIDMRLRPTGKNGILTVAIDELTRYFAKGKAQLWERQALCKARIIYGTGEAASRTVRAIEKAAYGPAWKPEFATEIRDMRKRLEETASKRNLKRGLGGTVDTEFMVQMMQLRYGPEDSALRVSGTLQAIYALRAGGYLSADDAAHFDTSYRFQRSIEARIRLMDSSGRHELPTDEKVLNKLAFLIGYANPKKLEADALEAFQENRIRFNRIFDTAAK